MPNKYQINDLIYVTITEVKPYAAFFITDDNQLGMIHISELSDDFIRDIDQFISIKDVIKIKILNIDEKDGFIRGSYKQVDDKDKFSSHVNVRQGLSDDEKEFKPLQDNINYWIKSTIKRKGLK